MLNKISTSHLNFFHVNDEPRSIQQLFSEAEKQFCYHHLKNEILQ